MLITLAFATVQLIKHHKNNTLVRDTDLGDPALPNDRM